jgi:phosphoglycolate phosphatase
VGGTRVTNQPGGRRKRQRKEALCLRYFPHEGHCWVYTSPGQQRRHGRPSVGCYLSVTVRPLIYLFDIDGTLVTTAGSGRKALCAAFEQRYGSCRGLDFSFDGMTDRAIVSIALAAMGLHFPGAKLEPEIDAVLDEYIAALALLAKATNKSFEVCQGVYQILDQVHAAGLGVVGLGTGNIRKGAEIKLAAVDLYHRFAFGGFGCDHPDRTTLLAVGAKRGADLLRMPLNQCDVLVIGDTPKDIAAAHGIGARCLAVATGNYALAELNAAGADVSVASLTDPQALSVLLPPRP